jgi:HNH endonuclease
MSPWKEGVHYRVGTSGCWVWLRGRKGKEAKTGGGYPCWKLNGKTVGVHRVVCERVYGRMLPTQQARHTCHNTLCINPGHLIPGTNTENQRDSAVAGRRAQKLTAEAVRDIKRSCASGVLQRVMGEKYGIAQADVSHIVNGHWWAHVSP